MPSHHDRAGRAKTAAAERIDRLNELGDEMRLAGNTDCAYVLDIVLVEAVRAFLTQYHGLVVPGIETGKPKV